MTRRTIAALTVAALLTGCATPSDGAPPVTIEDTACGYRFEPISLIPLPREVRGIVPTHAVRAQAYACSEGLWQEIGGLAAARIDAISMDPRVTSGVVEAGGGGPWPYENASARLGFEFPIFIKPGIEVTVMAGFDSFLDANEMLSCWLVTPDGRTVPGSQFYTVQTRRGSLTSVDCGGHLGTTA